MDEKSLLKMEGMKFGRLLLSVFRISSMFSPTHRAADVAVRQSFEALNAIVLRVQQFTFGFMDHRVLINNILIPPDRTLKVLEAEFSKRGLGAVTFPAGIALGAYRRVLAVICASPNKIEQEGGIKKYFDDNKVEGVRVIPGVKGSSSLEETTLEGDPESLMAMQGIGIGDTKPGFGLDLLLEAVGMSGTGSGIGGQGQGQGSGSGGGTGTGSASGDAAASGRPGGQGGPGGAGVPGPGGPGGAGGMGMGGTLGAGPGGGGLGTGSGVGPGGRGLAGGGRGDDLGPSGSFGSGAGTGYGAAGSAGSPGAGPGFGPGAGPGFGAGAGPGGGTSSGPNTGTNSGAVGGGWPGVPRTGVDGTGGTGATGGENQPSLSANQNATQSAIPGAPPGGWFGAGASQSSVPGGGTGEAAHGSSGAGGSGYGGVYPGGGSAGGGYVSGAGVAPATSGSGQISAPGAGFAAISAAALAGNPVQVLDVARKAIDRSLSNPATDPTQALNALSRMLEEFNPEKLMPALSPEKQQAYRGRPAREVATDMMEDVAAQWATTRLASASSDNIALTEEEVVRVLQKSLDATQTVERMLQKLSKLFEKANLPSGFFERIQQELRWQGLSDDERFKQLMGLHRYTAAEFKRLVTYVKDLMARGKTPLATQLCEHYFAILELSEHELQPTELARAPELLQLVARAQTREFMQKIAARLTEALLDEHIRGWYHTHITICLMTVSQSMAPYEDFAAVQKIGSELEKSRLRHPDHHSDCCAIALASLLPMRSIERLIELYSSDRESQKMVHSIVKLMGTAGIEKVFQRLEEERVASNRMALMRLIIQSGPAATKVARKRLNDPRWYVVRNACFVLNDLHDPELIGELRTVIRHPDERVQQAAFNVISKSRAPGRASALADALPHLCASVLDSSLDELRFLKMVEAVRGLETYITSAIPGKQREQEKAMQALAAIPDDDDVSAEAIARILKNEKIPVSVRKLAVKALGKSESAAAYPALAEVASRAPNDPLAPDCQSALEIS